MKTREMLLMVSSVALSLSGLLLLLLMQAEQLTLTVKTATLAALLVVASAAGIRGWLSEVQLHTLSLVITTLATVGLAAKLLFNGIAESAVLTTVVILIVLAVIIAAEIISKRKTTD